MNLKHDMHVLVPILILNIQHNHRWGPHRFPLRNTATLEVFFFSIQHKYVEVFHDFIYFQIAVIPVQEQDTWSNN